MAAEAKHRDAIVRTAVRLLRQQGYAATGLNQISVESGAPKGSLYHYFPNGKAQIGAAAVRRAADVVEATLRDLTETAASPSAFIRAYGALLARWMTKSDFRQGCPIATTLLEMAPGDSDITAAGEAAFAAWARVIAEVLTAGGVEAKRAAGLADLAICAIEGALIRTRVRRSAAPILSTCEDLAALFEASSAHATSAS